MNRIKRTTNFVLGIVALAATALALTAGAAAETEIREEQRPATAAEAEPPSTDAATAGDGSPEAVTEHPDGMLSLVVGPRHDAALQAGESQDGTSGPELRCSEAAPPGGAGSPSKSSPRAEKE